MTPYVLLGIVMLATVLQVTKARCRSDWDPCKDQSDCCPGFTCTNWGPSQSRCKRDGNTQCGASGSDCGLFSWCCEGLTCVQKNRKFECNE